MRTWLILILMLTLVGCSGLGPPNPFDCTTVVEGSQKIVKVENARPGRYIVVMKSGAVQPSGLFDVQAMSGLAASYGAQDVQTFARLGSFAAALSEADAVRLAADPQVAFVQEDGTKRVNPLAAQEGATWGLDRSDQRALPLNGTYDPGDRPEDQGAGVHVYVIDTGIDTDHPEFAGRMGEGFTAHLFGGIEDDHGHGTHVAGTVGGTEFGIAKQVILHPVRVLKDGRGADSDVIRGIDWVTDHALENGWPAVANMSLGGDSADALDVAVCRSIARGVFHAVAAGNDSSVACGFSPARVKQAVTAGASTKRDRKASFSNRGECVDLFAPGEDIRSARRFGGGTALSGTSMASPHLAGIAALCLARRPGSTPDETFACLQGTATRDAISNPGSGSANLLGYARDESPE